jgi:tetratricopeptide (TPR) repeat protein
VDKDKIGLDLSAFGLVTALLKHENGKIVNTAIKKINKYLEQNVVGYSFQLIDCMNLLGIASFYLEKYSDAYESFLLVLELYQSLCEKETASLRSESCDEELDLRSEDIYFNIIICEFAQGNAGEALRMIREEYGSVIS